MINRLKDLLLEFDPRKTLSKSPRTAFDKQLASGDVLKKFHKEQNKPVSERGPTDTRSKLLKRIVTKKKEKNRELARGPFTKDKGVGPKGKLPEALERALLEFDPRKTTTHASMKAFGKELGKGQSAKKAKKVANRELARGSGDIIGNPRSRLARRDMARQIRNINRQTKAKLG